MGDKKTLVGVFGIGAIGSAISVQLQSAKERIELLYYNRSPKSSIGLLDGKTEFDIPIHLTNLEKSDAELDWLLVCIKENHYPEALNSLSNLVSPKTMVAVIRNGLKHKEPFLPFTDASRILECTIDCPTQPITDGYYESLRKPVITAPESELASQFGQLLHNSDTEVRQVSDFKSESWKKVCESSALGAILCLTGETCWIFEDEKLVTLYTDLLQEGIAAARADGAHIKPDFKDKMIAKLLSYPKTKGSSMLTDRLNGNPVELGAKNGVISDIGKELGVDTPLNDLVVTLLGRTNTFRKGTMI